MVYHQEIQPTTLDPLPITVRHSIYAMVIPSFVSLVSSIGLFAYLTIRLWLWYTRGQLKTGPNQYLILLYNLVFADINQALAFVMPSGYLAHNKIDVGTSTCWANGWFISTGDLASSVFILALSLHTCLAVVKGRRINDKPFFIGIAALWIFVYAMAVIGICLKPNYYTRAGAWCWVNFKYKNERLWLHYFWIFFCMFGTIVIYTYVFIAMVTDKRSNRATVRSSGSDNQDNPKTAAKYMIIYPAVYVVCTLPLAAGRMAAMAGIVIPYWYYGLAGAFISSCGWLDVLLYSLTRRTVVFSSLPPAREDFGLGTFARRYSGDGCWGVKTTVSGPLTISRIETDGNFFCRILARLRRKSVGKDSYFATPTIGVIRTKTTIEIQGGDITHCDRHDSCVPDLLDENEQNKKISMSTSDDIHTHSDCEFLTTWDPSSTCAC